MSSRKRKSNREMLPAITQADADLIYLPCRDELISRFYGMHHAEVAAAIATWLHSPDCSPDARSLIALAAKVDGQTKDDSFAQYLFKCPMCCDYGRIADLTKIDWVPCPDCKNKTL